MKNDKDNNEKKPFTPCFIEVIHLVDVILTSNVSSANGDEMEEDEFNY